ncbi:DUF6691 family protein [Rhodobacter sp. SY28-1]|uniref:DUF6691 family protein n=1 Tax=Rhodobacter sp. SY28-1 TaxID=2562317 RepID=UPI0010C0A851|nr:DUF6691 family protein [Rhodobacter sp. SY28-1]
MRLLSAFAIGLIFGLGIAVSGMINPAKVLNFFDLAGTWDPSLAFVMGGALAVAIPGYRLVLRQPAPALDTRFQLPDTRIIDGRLVLGSATFGVGWGIAGFCPGGALPALGTGSLDVFVFILSLILGLLIARHMQRRGLSRKPA